MSYIVPKEIPNCCGRCPCFHAEHPMYCQAVKADKNKRIYAPYGEGRPDWCPLTEIPTPHGRLIDADELKKCVLKWLPQDPCGREEKEMPFETDICVSMLMEIDEQPTITPEPHWIPVTERLPEIGEYVLCAVKQPYRGRFHVCKYVDKDKYHNHPYFDWWHNGFPDVIAWIPLPESYEEVTE